MYKLTALILIICVIIGLAVSMNHKANEPIIDNTQSLATKTTTANDLKRLLAFDDSPERLYKLKQFYSQTMVSSPVKALTFISALEAFSDRQLCYSIALSEWLAIDAKALTLWLQNQTPQAERDLALQHLISLTSELQQSLLFAEKLSQSEARNTALNQLFHLWAKKVPERIVLWSMTQKVDQKKWLTLAFKLIGQDSQVKAIKTLSILDSENPTQVRTAIQSLIDHYEFGIINNEALSALQSLKPYSLKEEAIMGLLPLLVNELHLSLSDIQDLLESLLPGEQQDNFYELVALNWAKKEPVAAANYAQSLTGDARSRAVNAVTATWIEEDLEATDKWLKTLDGDLNMAAATIGRGAAKLGNVQISNEWLGAIEDEEQRASAIGDALKNYYQQSPAAGIYQLVYQKQLTIQQKLDMLHQIYPNETFLSPDQALDELDRLEAEKTGSRKE